MNTYEKPKVEVKEFNLGNVANGNLCNVATSAGNIPTEDIYLIVNGEKNNGIYL